MTLEEINSQIEEIDKKIEILKNTISIAEEEKQNKFNKVQSLLIELTSVERLYYDYRTLLAFTCPDELADEYRKNIESQMPVLKEISENIRAKLDNIEL